MQLMVARSQHLYEKTLDASFRNRVNNYECRCSILVWSGERRGKVPEKKLQDLLGAGSLSDLARRSGSGTAGYITSVRTFEEAGAPTEDRGLPVALSNGYEYQITIVKSR